MRHTATKEGERKEKVSCWNLPQLADSVRLATPLARFGKVVRTATNQKVGSSNLSGRTTSFWVFVFNNIKRYPLPRFELRSNARFG